MIDVKDAPDLNRYEIHVDGELAGLTEYRLAAGQISFTHTEIAEVFGGRGLAGQLVRYALDDVRSRDLAVLPFCPYVRSYIKRHPAYLDLVPETQRERFDLP
ncbi:GNAT family N-acetyltransferase [Longispora albida]|uniref:GNAT family N-acetyltransferase n=1 Tax=Longispora albida TaxID=203523 RepID=UPI0003686B85|nr:GNAT family N-acetyltransferase [Longispora albida]